MDTLKMGGKRGNRTFKTVLLICPPSASEVLQGPEDANTQGFEQTCVSLSPSLAWAQLRRRPGADDDMLEDVGSQYLSAR